jgi:hypothetical protein
MKALPVTDPQGTDTEMLDKLLRETFPYFISEVNAATGLIADKTMPGSPSSIAAVGMALSSFVVAVKRNIIDRGEAVERTLKILRFFYNSHQGPEINAMGYKGFYYHFLDMETGERVWDCELSTVDTTFFIAGALSCANYFTGHTDDEKEISRLADELYKRIDWQWALNGTKTICLGWKPGSGFLPYYWDRDYSEALLMYTLALGSPTFPIGAEGYKQWTDTFQCQTLYNIDHLYSGPLFIHQLSHIWIDFRGIQDDFNRRVGIDYFENSKRATYVQQAYAIENKPGFAHYGKYCWGFTASDGPGVESAIVNGKLYVFYDYIARGAPFGPDDGTVSPWAVVASLPFAPEIVLDTIRHAIERLNLKKHSWYGFDASFNPSYPVKERNPNGWVSPWKFGLNQGPIILMIENYESGLLWEVMKRCPYIKTGLRKAGFRNGWLDSD